MILIDWVKMHGLGNVILVAESDRHEAPLTVASVHALVKSHGMQDTLFDQLMILTRADMSGDCDYVCQIYNADGSVAEQCGNGMRCVARYLSERQGYGDRSIRIGVGGAVTEVRWDGVLGYATLAVPSFPPEYIPFNPNALNGQGAQNDASAYVVRISGVSLHFSVVNIGNPHAVIDRVACGLSDAVIEAVAPLFIEHPCFPEGVNVGFFENVSRSEINLRVYERGAGWTLACGSGAAAAVAAGRRADRLDSSVQVCQPGGVLRVFCDNLMAPIAIQGPAEWMD